METRSRRSANAAAESQAAEVTATSTAVTVNKDESAQQMETTSIAEQSSSKTVRTTSISPTANKSGGANNNNNNNGNNNSVVSGSSGGGGKGKSQQQHQFRAPQQLAQQRKSSTSLSKRNKTWNKRQNKTGKQQQQQQVNNIETSTAAADLENYQNIKNQTIGIGGGHHYYHGPQYFHGHARAVAEGRIANINGMQATVLPGLEKMAYGHNFHKTQLHKKMLSHRLHHVLCSGSSHNALVVGTGNPGCCCRLNSCISQNNKDNISVNSHSNMSNTSGNLPPTALHYCCGRSKFFLPEKRPRKEIIVPPTKFLLGGNISDPLNLNSLQNECKDAESNNNTPATTPCRSPITTPPKVEVIIPPNIRDPLHLLDPVDSKEYEKQLTSPLKRNRRGVNKTHRLNRQRKNRKMKRQKRDSLSSIGSISNPKFNFDAANSLANSTISTESFLHSMSVSSNVSSNVSAATASDQNSILVGADSSQNKRETISTASLTAAVASTSVASLSRLADEPRERRDLRLDLNMALASDAGNLAAASGRKRKISESNNSQKNKRFHRHDSLDKIVSPVVPQPGAWKRHLRVSVASGSRKPHRRSVSTSETDALSPVEEPSHALKIETTDISKQDGTDTELVSPQSTITGEQDSLADVSVSNTSHASICITNVSVPLATTQEEALKDNKPKLRPNTHKYQYGNHDRYIDYRQLNEFNDVRLQVFQRHTELFKNKDILDIGCNVGNMTITVARNLLPKSILGIDIDKDLIVRARKNLSLFVPIPNEAMPRKKTQTQQAKIETTEEKPTAVAATAADKAGTQSAAVTKHRRRKRAHRRKSAMLRLPHTYQLPHLHHHFLHHHHHYVYYDFQNNNVQRKQQLHVDSNELFPVSFALTYGGIPANAVAALAEEKQNKAVLNKFPYNVFFRHENYVPKDESQICNEAQQQYDLILCLSVTKWIHLNYGDTGLKSAFKRMFNQLRPGGKLILEAQNWASYKKKKGLTENIHKNYQSIEFFPNKFHEYLLSSDVGFSHCITLGVPRHMNKGFCRPIQLYAKGDYTPNHVRWSDAYYPQTPYEEYRGIYAPVPARSTDWPLRMSSTRSQPYDTPHHTGSGSGSYSSRHTPMYQPTSQYYNPHETDSYQPSYDMDYLNHMYVFASPQYQTAWSPPPASQRKSSSHTPLFGSVREAEFDGDGSVGCASASRHVYPPNDDTCSPNANAGGAFNSIRDADTDDSNQLPASGQHVYATNCDESSLSRQVLNSQDAEVIEEPLVLDDVASTDNNEHSCD